MCSRKLRNRPDYSVIVWSGQFRSQINSHKMKTLTWFELLRQKGFCQQHHWRPSAILSRKFRVSRLRNPSSIKEAHKNMTRRVQNVSKSFEKHLDCSKIKKASGGQVILQINQMFFLQMCSMDHMLLLLCTNLASVCFYTHLLHI